MYEILYNLSGLFFNHLNMLSAKYVTASEGRQNLPSLIKQVSGTGEIVVLTQHGKPKVAIIDFDFLDEIVENIEFGITSEELDRRAEEAAKGETISHEEFKKKYGL